MWDRHYSTGHQPLAPTKWYINQNALNGQFQSFELFPQVEYLLEHGADVNRGLKSSSLHYGACFGRPNIVKLLLQYGADPDLRDEDGHTPLEKAQERGDEWHRQVIEILENPSTSIEGGWGSICGDIRKVNSFLT